MGLLRLLFALSVLIFHAGLVFGYNIANREIAVCSFFIISGFYMALILDKKYTKNKSWYLFWSNRFLRIFPLYWFVLLITFAFTLAKFHLGIGDNAITHYVHWAAPTTQFYFILDLINYIIRNLTLIINIDYFRVNDSTSGYLLIQQAWTLQMELLFYLLAPVLAHLSKRWFIAVVSVYVVGFFGFVLPMQLLPLNLVHMFLSHFIYFLLGMISYKFIYMRVQKKKIHVGILRLVFVAVVCYLLLYNVLPVHVGLPILGLEDSVYYAFFVISMPFIFLLTKANVVDRFIGNLSYPLYITHFFITKLVANMPLFHAESTLRTGIIIMCSLMFSYVLVKLIEDPIDRFRQRRVSG